MRLDLFLAAPEGSYNEKPGSVCALDDEDIQLVITKMARHNIRRLPVVREDGKLVGIVARTDILWGWQMQWAKEKLIAVV